MELSELKPILLRLKGTKIYNFQNLDIKGISYNSKQVKPGDLFVAIPGTKTDGSYFIPEALQRGATAIIAHKKINLFTLVPYIMAPDPRSALALASSHFYHYPSRKLKVIGITGTNGKTTTAYLLKNILEKAGYQTGLLGTIEYLIGERQIPAPVTTPQSYDLQYYFSEMLKNGAKYAVMEVSSHSLVQKRVMGIEFHRAVFTNLTRDHLDFHRTLNQYKQAKALLFSKLSPESIAVLNADDPNGGYYAAKTSAQAVWYHLSGNPTRIKFKSATPVVQAQTQESSLSGNTLLLKTPIGEMSIQNPLIGQHNIYNILAAAATAVSLGIPVETIREGIENTKIIKGRMEPVPANTGYKVIVDFGHTDNALKNVLSSLRPLVKGKIITVFGCGGDRDKGKRPLMGKVASKLSDLCVITSDNPRSEDPLKIISDIRKGIRRKTGCHVEPDRYEAIKKALTLAQAGDLVLIAGKGHETYQIFKDTVKPFDDREAVKKILE